MLGRGLQDDAVHPGAVDLQRIEDVLVRVEMQIWDSRGEELARELKGPPGLPCAADQVDVFGEARSGVIFLDAEPAAQATSPRAQAERKTSIESFGQHRRSGRRLEG